MGKVSYRDQQNCKQLTTYFHENVKEDAKMQKLNELAKAYEPQRTRNVTEIDKIPVDIEVHEETHTKKEDGSEFTIKVINIDGEKYRVPNSVLENLKALLEKVPKTTHIRVISTGSGMSTRYQVIPLIETKTSGHVVEASVPEEEVK